MEPVPFMHRHVLAVVNSERRPGPLRLLDLGCGDGRLLALLQRELCDAELSGLDVSDPGVQQEGFLDGARARVGSSVPLSMVREGERWPHEDESLDVVVSNQVLEHVRDLDFVFAEVSRVLRDGGFSVHVFPLRSYLFETHLRLPFSHRFRDHDALRAFIVQLSRLGLGKHKDIGGDVDDYAEAHADYQWFLTAYHSRSDVTEAAKRAGLRASFRYTPDMYANRLRSVPRASYTRPRNPLVDNAMTHVLQFVSSVSLFLEKANRYHQPAMAH